MKSVGVISKEIGHSIQNFKKIILKLDNYQNLSYKQFLKATQNGKLHLWTRCLCRYCTLMTLCKSFFAMAVKPMYEKYAPGQNFSPRFFCTLFIIITAKGRSYKRDLFSSFYLGLNSGVFD